MSIKVVDIPEKFSLFSDHWSPRIVAQMNDYHFKIAKVQGDFVWHSHAETDETFIIIKGELIIKLRDRDLHLSSGQMCVIPKGVEHKPVALNECAVMLVEPTGTINTGDSGGGLTKQGDEWI